MFNRPLSSAAMLALAFILSSLYVPREVAGGQEVVLRGSTTCESCAISIVERLELVSPLDSILYWPRMAVSASGDIFLLQHLGPVTGLFVFASNGTFIERIMPQMWNGATDYTMAPIRIASSSSGEIWLQDTTGRLISLDANGGYGRPFARIPKTMSNLVVLSDSVVGVVGGTRPLTFPDREAHLYDSMSGQVVSGLGPRSDLRIGADPVVVQMAPGAGQRVWVVVAPNTIQLWSVLGQLEASIRFAPGWTAHVDNVYEGYREATNYAIHDVWQDHQRDLLWIASIVSDPRTTVAEFEEIPGRPIPLESLDPEYLNAANNTIVTVLNTEEWEVVAHRELSAFGYQFLADGRMVVAEVDEASARYPVLLQMEVQAGRGR